MRKSITVKAPRERAFEVFTAQMGRWWHPDHHILKSPLKAAVVENRAGGRWYEVGEDGSECEWGSVLVWEPPARMVFTWQLTGEWKYDPDFVTEVEVRFIPEGSDTRVELEHRHLESYGEKAEAVRASAQFAGRMGRRAAPVRGELRKATELGDALRSAAVPGRSGIRDINGHRRKRRGRRPRRFRLLPEVSSISGPKRPSAWRSRL